MKIIEAINGVDTKKPNKYSFADKIKWLSQLDHRIKLEIIDTHEGGEDIIFNGYDENTKSDTELLVGAPHDDIYGAWLEAQIDYANGEYDRYDNSYEMYNSLFSNYSNWYNRTHKPKAVYFKYF